MPKRKHGSGTVYKRGKIWWLSYYANGEHICESSHQTDKGEAGRQLRERMGKIAEGTYVGPRADRVTFEEMKEDMLKDYRINQRKSIKDAERSVSALGRFFGGRKAKSIEPRDIATYKANRQADGLTNGSINRELAALKRMFNLALQNGNIISKPHIEMLEENNVRQGFFEWTDFESIRDRLPAYLQPPMIFAYLTGWRVRSEVLTLCWSNVDIKAGTVRLEPGTTKNKDGRVIYMTPELKSLLEAQRAKTLALQRQTDQIITLVFHNEGQPICNYYKAWHNACREAGLSGKIPHDFRRTAVRSMVRAGIPERVAMQMTGHKTRSVFDRYHIVSDGDLKEAAQKLSEAHLATNLATVAPMSSSKAKASP